MTGRSFPLKGCVPELAGAMGVEILTEAQYHELQQVGEFDTKSSSRLKTPVEIRTHGGAVFGDRRFGRVFIYLCIIHALLHHAARGMAAMGLLSPADAAALRLRWCFGQLTGNTDMHLANASVWLGDEEPFRLAPVYDMLPMVFAPGAQGEIVPREFTVPPVLPALREARAEAVPWAREFWGRVEADESISASFREMVRHAADAVVRVAAE